MRKNELNKNVVNVNETNAANVCVFCGETHDLKKIKGKGICEDCLLDLAKMITFLE
jgi:NMD protein affecting ribosome stability and mRNA decay